MKTFSHNIRVRYADTDQMGFVYYGKYAEYFEVARVETLRESGYTYLKMEEDGFLLPVIEYNIKYYKPATYDVEVQVKSSVEKLSETKIKFIHKCFVGEKQLNEAYVILACIDSTHKRPIAIPEEIFKVLA